MSELQVGGLALVIGVRFCQENIGKIVEVEEIQKEEVLVRGEGLVGYLELQDKKIDSPIFWALKCHLMPINPEADPLDVTHKEELHA